MYYTSCHRSLVHLNNYKIEMYVIIHNITGTEDYLCPFDARDLNKAYEYAVQPDPPGSLEFLIMCMNIMQDNHLTTLPNTAQEALDLYVTLTATVELHIM